MKRNREPETGNRRKKGRIEMAEGMKYPKEDIPCEIKFRVGDKTVKISDALAQLTITPYFGFWGVDEIWKMHFGGGGKVDIAAVRTLESYPTKELAQAYIEGFLAGRVKRKRLIDRQPEVTVKPREEEGGTANVSDSDIE
ncbi:hypothetical protein LCGC14_0377140 [marine sediment metagenome]|uniref:Uncharacterized protein n=1 Tax=marine sediment metagenome TaxID=412755 RepID=A0A0F9WCD3_9ZZZZ